MRRKWMLRVAMVLVCRPRTRAISLVFYRRHRENHSHPFSLRILFAWSVNRILSAERRARKINPRRISGRATYEEIRPTKTTIRGNVG